VTYRVCTGEVRATTVTDGPNAKCPANEDDGTGEDGLDALMSLEPSIGRGPHIACD